MAGTWTGMTHSCCVLKGSCGSRIPSHLCRSQQPPSHSLALFLTGISWSPQLCPCLCWLSLSFLQAMSLELERKCRLSFFLCVVFCLFKFFLAFSFPIKSFLVPGYLLLFFSLPKLLLSVSGFILKLGETVLLLLTTLPFSLMPLLFLCGRSPLSSQE